MRAVRYGLIGASSAAIVTLLNHLYPLSRLEAAIAVGILTISAGFCVDLISKSKG